jgi:hypothetical protein
MGSADAAGRVDSTGKVVWEDWHPGHCDPAKKISPGWWHDQQQASLADFLGRVITAFADPDRLPALRLQLMFGITAMNDRGFVEQRLMMGAAGLEHLMWQTLVLEGGMSERQYHDQDAHEELRRLLTDAQTCRTSPVVRSACSTRPASRIGWWQ